MSDRTPAVSRTRVAVRALLDTATSGGHLEPGCLDVACSGGADSLALAAAAVYEGHRRGLVVRGVVVDHGLQPGSREVAERAAEQLVGLGVDETLVLRPEVAGGGGVEAAARRARYQALRGALRDPRQLVLLGHTLDDQAETVLLGLGRGSGPRSISGMRALDPPWGRPLLGCSRAVTARACRELGLEPWTDPHNSDPRFTRVRLRREVLPLLEEVLQGGVAEALCRTSAQLREDGAALDQWADEVLSRAGSDQGHGALEVRAVEGAPVAVRRRVLRGWLISHGARELTDLHLRAVDDLVGRWRGQGGVWLPGGLVVERAHGRLQVGRPAG
ncbi:tRNA lysidine(34) synthetase TilS [Actinoalloteichus caeruleus]|uniref:tRNA(Ile)-lysidine synthase n=1 Tax=Actinoalloteichus caeruleus DSM 43889 TaxID=1120930 RepID=A0ABT1JK15_ACTCY|nr:tRNA lysidine(34) synthetase TilS [Actinoalloteichus caeruleus]MCP2332687.1 tRNA(Ile)-lysidine synthase [Actinoalloteichus caeruleus DSM 43889]